MRPKASPLAQCLATLALLWCAAYGFGMTMAMAEGPPTVVDTAAGPLTIVQLDEGNLGRHFRVTLSGKTILETGESGESGDFPFPRVIGRFTAQAAPYDDLLLLQQFDWGNACNGGPLWFLGINRDGSFKRFDFIDFCGGPAPIVEARGATVELRMGGDSPEVWALEKGKLRKVR